MKNELISIYSKHPKSLSILIEILDLHELPFELIQKEEHLIHQSIPNSKCLIVDSFISKKMTGVDFLMRNIKKFENITLFVFRTHHLSKEEEVFISENNINILSKPIFPMMAYKRLSQVIKI